MDDNMSGNYTRSEEELAWDEEFRNDSGDDLARTVRGVIRFATRLPLALIEVPLEILPSDTRRHAKAAARESFLAVRSLFGAMADKVEEVLSESGASVSTVQGPAGTWGTARASTGGTTSSAKVKRIQVTEEEELEGKVPSDAPGDMP